MDSPPEAQIDARPDAVVVAGPVMLERFTVILDDRYCSGHSHGFTVSAGTYQPEERHTFRGGSHEVEFSTEELVALHDSAHLPFATIGQPPGGHGHSGIAYRQGTQEPEESEYPDEPLQPGTHCTLG